MCHFVPCGVAWRCASIPHQIKHMRECQRARFEKQSKRYGCDECNVSICVTSENSSFFNKPLVPIHSLGLPSHFSLPSSGLTLCISSQFESVAPLANRNRACIGAHPRITFSLGLSQSVNVGLLAFSFWSTRVLVSRQD